MLALPTLRARSSEVARAVEDGRSGWFRIDRDAWPRATRALAGAVREAAPVWPSPWAAAPPPLRQRLAALDDAARLDFAFVVALLGLDPGPAWRWRASGGGALAAAALPAAQQDADALMSMLDQAAAGAAPRPRAGDAADVATASATTTATTTATAATGAPDEAPSGGTAALLEALWQGFDAGMFSATRGQPRRVEATALRSIDAAAMRAAFGAGPAQPLAGLEARAAFAVRLGQALADERRHPAHHAVARPADAIGAWLSAGGGAAEAWAWLAQRFAGVWSGSGPVLGLPAPDTWRHRWCGASIGGSARDAASAGWLPIAQPVSRLVATLAAVAAEGSEAARRCREGIEALPAPAPGGFGALLLEAGVVVPRDARWRRQPCKPGDEIVVEWRALTVSLADELAAAVGAAGAFALDAAAAVAARQVEGGSGAGGLAVAGDGVLF